MGTTQASLADIIATAIQDQGLTVQAIATTTLIPRTTLDRSLSGIRPITTNELTAIAGALGTTGSALLAAAEGVVAA